jgi:hypothetical protein
VPAASQTMGNVLAMTIHEGTLFALGGSPFTAGGTEQIWSVPVTGGNIVPVASVTPVANGYGSPFGLVVDASHLNWGSFDGNVYTCSTATTCTPTVLVPGARPFGMAQDATHVYWADNYGGAIYSVLKP